MFAFRVSLRAMPLWVLCFALGMGHPYEVPRCWVQNRVLPRLALYMIAESKRRGIEII